jgi:hypothetical protein
MAYSITTQRSLDLNWFFFDRFKHLCHVASGGGLLPNIIVENDLNNDKFNEIVYDLPEAYEFGRNESVLNILSENGVTDLESYFREFETMARKGLFSFDKYLLENPEDQKYFLVAYPIYKPYIDKYPVSNGDLELT